MNPSHGAQYEISIDGARPPGHLGSNRGHRNTGAGWLAGERAIAIVSEYPCVAAQRI